MRISLALGPRQPLSRQTAWGCFTSNLALPGVGSLVAGRRVGYAQFVLAIVGMFMTTGFGLRFGVWYLHNWDRVNSSQTDPMAALAEMWQVLRWAVLGMALFGVAWLWGVTTGLNIVRSASQAEESKTPPRIP